jgi:hypothetical protein
MGAGGGDAMHDYKGLGRVEDYTDAFLVSFGLLVFMLLIALWAMLGYPAALAAAFLGDRVMRRAARAR